MNPRNSIGQGALDLDVPGLQTEFDFFDEPEPDDAPDTSEAQRSLDDLVSSAGRYLRSKDFRSLLEFIRRFHWYSPFNALLVQIQMPGAVFVATAHKWRTTFGRAIRAEARPLIILQPRGPVLVVYDVSDTDASGEAATLPADVIAPFRARTRLTEERCHQLVRQITDNAARDGVRVAAGPRGTHRGADVRSTDPGRTVFWPGTKETPGQAVPLRYEVVTNDRLDAAGHLRALLHELAHVYCGHLGTPDERWWPDRSKGLDEPTVEFEADVTAWIVFSRIDPLAEIDHHLAQYLNGHETVPRISLARVLAAAGLLCEMTKMRLPSREKVQARRDKPTRRATRGASS